MKKIIYVIMFLLTIGFVSVGMANAATGPNLLTNGDFSAGTSSWETLINAAVTFSTTEGVAGIGIVTAGNTYFQNTGTFTLEAGKTYRITFDAWSTNGNNIKAFVYKSGTPTRYTHPLPDQSFDLTDDWQTFTYDFVPTIGGPVSDALLAFDLREDVAGMQFFFDNVKIQSLNESDPDPITVVTGYIYFPNGSVVVGADVHVECGIASQDVPSIIDGSYWAEFDVTVCQPGDLATVTANFDGMSGTNSSVVVCGTDECPVNVALVDVTIPEITVLGATAVLLAGLGIVLYRRKH